MENKYKEYYNKELEKILKNYITRRRYGEFAEVLEDIFQRRAYEYGFSESEIEEQVKNFVKNVRKIKFAPQKKFKSDKVAAYYTRRKIILNQDYFIKREENVTPTVLGMDIYSILSHEVYHAIVDEPEGCGLIYYNIENGEKEGAALEEVFTEVASNRTNFNKDNEFDTNTKGYTEITFTANLLSAALGTTEKELFKNGSANRTKLMSFFYSRFSNKEDADFAKKTYFDKFEESLNILYNVEYSNLIDENKSLANELETTALISLYESCYDLLSFQISSDKINTSPKYVSEVVYRFYKIRTIIADSKSRFFLNAFLKGRDEDLQKVNDAIANSEKRLLDKIVAMYEISKNFDKFPDHVIYYEQFESAKRGMTPEKRNNLAEKYGIEIPEDSEYALEYMLNSNGIDSEYREFIQREDFDNGKIWDNRRSAELARNAYIHEMERKGIRAGNLPRKIGTFDKAIRTINILISKLKNKQVQELLVTSKEDSDIGTHSVGKAEGISEFDKRYKVEPKGIKAIKRQKEILPEIKKGQEHQDEKESK